MLTRTVVMLPAILLSLPFAFAADEREPGLLVRFYQIGHAVHAIPELAPDQLPNAVKLVPTLELRTKRGDFAPFEGNFYTEVDGFVAVRAAGTYTFRLISDDGSMLWIDGRLVVNHDGPHGAVPKDGKIELAAGEHTLRVAHFESGGEEHLELQWCPPGAEADKFALIPAGALTHDKHVSRETSPGDKRVIPPLRRGLPGDGSPVAGTHPSFDYELLATPMIGLQEAPVECSRLNVQTIPSRPDDSLILVPLGDPHAGKVSVAFLSDLRDPDRQWTSAKGEVKFDPCRVAYVVADCTHTLYRVVPDDVDGVLQGCAFRFATGLPERVVALHSAIPNAVVAWFDVSRQPESPRPQALCFMRPNERVTFEVYAVRAMTNGFEIEFTKPLDPRCGWEPEAYYVEQWPFVLGSNGATERRSDEASGREAQASAHPPRRDGVRYPVKSASVSADRKTVFLEIPDLKESHVVYIRLLPPCYSEDGERPWSTEAWYTLNAIPQDRYGRVLTPPEPEPQNFLTAEEQAAGWELLFDGETTAGWRGYRKDDMPAGWQIEDGCLVRVGPGGDIISEGEFDNFELELEWRICAAGNSGIFYRVSEDYDWPFFTGPEFQVLDNAEHADGKSRKTSAGSNYALHAPVRDVTAPVGFFNQARIVCDGPHVEHWLNGVKIVEYELWTDEWKRMVAGSKFKAWPNYGLMKTGHIVLQDHGDRVSYRNIKIRRLGT